MRTKQVTVAGKQYWLNWSGRCQVNIEAYKRTPGYDPRTHTAETAYRTLYEEMIAGYLWAQKNGMNPANQPPTYDELLDTVGMDEMLDLTPDIMEIMTGVRNVVANPPKKDGAGESAD